MLKRAWLWNTGIFAVQLAAGGGAFFLSEDTISSAMTGVLAPVFLFMISLYLTLIVAFVPPLRAAYNFSLMIIGDEAIPFSIMFSSLSIASALYFAFGLSSASVLSVLFSIGFFVLGILAAALPEKTEREGEGKKKFNGLLFLTRLPLGIGIACGGLVLLYRRLSLPSSQ